MTKVLISAGVMRLSCSIQTTLTTTAVKVQSHLGWGTQHAIDRHWWGWRQQD